MKKILFIAHFCNDFDTIGNNRFNYMAQHLSKDNDLTFVTTDFSHRKKTYRNKIDNFEGIKIQMIHEKPYKRNISLARLYAHRTFGRNLTKYLNSIVEKPDVIYCSVPSLDGAYSAIKYGRKNNIKVIIDIQDLWPEAFQLVLNIPFIFSPMRRMADYVYSNADILVAVSETYINRAKKVNKDADTHIVFLGTNLNQFDENVKKNQTKDVIDNDKFKICYCGSLSKSYDIKCLIDAFDILLKKGYTNISLNILGDGTLRKDFESYAQTKNISVNLMGHIPYPQMCALLSESDICVNPIIRNSAGSIINKHADYAASGIPVVNSQESEEYRNLITKYNMGLNCNNSDPFDMAEKIEILLNNKDLRATMGANARKCAEELFDRNITYKKIFDIIENT